MTRAAIQIVEPRKRVVRCRAGGWGVKDEGRVCGFAQFAGRDKPRVFKSSDVSCVACTSAVDRGIAARCPGFRGAGRGWLGGRSASPGEGRTGSEGGPGDAPRLCCVWVHNAERTGGLPRVRTSRRFSDTDERADASHDFSGPLHLSCVLYSAMVCSYLRERTARMSRTSAVNPGGRRGVRAAIIGFAGYGLLVPTRAHRFLEPAPNFAYVEMVEDIPYQDGADLAGRYQDAVAVDSGFIDMAAPRLFWTSDETADLVKALRADAKAVSKRISESGFVYRQIIDREGEFGAIPL